MGHYLLRRVGVETSGFASGRLTVNVLPAFNMLRTSILPLCAPTISFTIASPSPVPCFSPPGRDGSAWIEPFEDVRQGFRWYANSCICHFHLHLRACPRRGSRASQAGSQGNTAPGRCMLEGVIHQVCEDLCQPVDVTGDRWQGGGFNLDRYACGLRLRGKFLGCILSNAGRSTGARRKSSVPASRRARSSRSSTMRCIRPASS